MPHDAKNRELKIGDRVVIPAIITGIGSGSGYCNCTVELTNLMPPENTKTAFSEINTRQVERNEKADREQNQIDFDKKEKEDAERAARTQKDAQGVKRGN